MEPGIAQSPISLEVRGLEVGFGDKTIIKDLDLTVPKGEIIGVVGGSGTGKTVLMRAILGLVPRRAGDVYVFGENISSPADDARRAMTRRVGMLFQHGALFSSLTVRQNIQVPMREYFDLPQALMDDLADLKLSMVGLRPEAAHQFPSELSGGMIKRAALARALALDPDIVFLDEPTSGLDPIGAGAFDELIARLRDTLGLTVYMVTHDLDSLHAVCDRIAVLGNKKILVDGTIETLRRFDHPWTQDYFNGPRGRMAAQSQARGH
ncbi:MAG: ATP-binding cassette domain-containing protein [Pseudomonadota bacterium]